MRKEQELTDPASCMARAEPQEMTFVLLGRDAAAPATVRFWAAERVRLGKNASGDPQIREALACAEVMESELKARSPGRAPEESCQQYHILTILQKRITEQACEIKRLQDELKGRWPAEIHEAIELIRAFATGEKVKPDEAVPNH